MELLSEENYQKYEAFVEGHPMGSITQSVAWHKVKHHWKAEVVVVREAGQIVAGVSVLVRQVPLLGVSLLYAPRGPVCDTTNEEHLKQLQQGIDQLAKKHNAYEYKVDPDILYADTEFADKMKRLGYQQELGDGSFSTIQARFNYRLYLGERTLEEVNMDFHHKTRYNIRLSQRKGVEVKIVGKEGLDDFIRLMKLTGQRDGFTTRSREYFETMMDSLGDHIRLYLAYVDGEAIAGSIATNYAKKTFYLYGCSDNAHRNTMSTYLLQWEMICWAHETGCTVYDLQGISGNYLDDEDPLSGLFRFKDGFRGQVDELAGEFNYVYKPTLKKLVEKGIDLNDSLRAYRRKKGTV